MFKRGKKIKDNLLERHEYHPNSYLAFRYVDGKSLIPLACLSQQKSPLPHPRQIC